MTRSGFAALGGLMAWVSLAAPASGQALDPAQWTLELRGEAPPAWSSFTVRAVVRIDDGWRLYSLTQPPGGPIPTRIWLPEEQPWALAGPIEGPDPVKEFDAVFSMDVETHAGRVEFALPVNHRGGPVAAPVRVKVRYQMCNGELCLRPKTVSLELPVGTEEPAPPTRGTTNR